MDPTLGFVLIALLVVAGMAYTYWRKKKTQDAYRDLLGRDGLQATHMPAGMGDGALARLRACPRGDRRYGLKYGVTGKRDVTLDGDEHTVECAAFVWWWEEKSTSTDSNGHTRTTYSKKDRVAGTVQLPVRVPPVSIAPEGLFTRLGIGGHGDVQVESQEFNRTFDVRSAERDRALVIRLLDPSFQAFLLEMFEGRHIELVADVLLVAGDPPGKVGDLFGDIGELPGARRDAALLASRIPASFWRGVTEATGPRDRQRP